MGVPTIKTGPMTVEEFYAFTDTRPDDGKWELIDGVPILNALPSGLHQQILINLGGALLNDPAPATAAILGSDTRHRRKDIRYQPARAGCDDFARGNDLSRSREPRNP